MNNLIRLLHHYLKVLYYRYPFEKYLISHTTLIIAFVCGTIAMVITMLIKKHIKKALGKYKTLYIIIPFIAICIASGLYVWGSNTFWYDDLSMLWMFASGAIAVGEYDMLERFRKHNLSGLIFLIFCILALGIEWCVTYVLQLEDHYKTCHAIVFLFSLYGVLGFFNPLKYITNHKNRRRA